MHTLASRLFLVFKVLGVVFVAHGLMLLGADEITSIERGWIRTIRPLGQILTLYGVNPYPWIDASLSDPTAAIATTILSWPGWAIFFGLGAVFALIGRYAD